MLRFNSGKMGPLSVKRVDCEACNVIKSGELWFHNEFGAGGPSLRVDGEGFLLTPGIAISYVHLYRV